MKTFVSGTLMVALFLIESGLFAAGNLKVGILPVSSEKVIFAVSTFCNSNFDLTVEDANGMIVYSNQNSEPTDNYHVECDLNELKSGNYKLKVLCHELTSIYPFTKSDEGIKVGKEKTTIKPFFGYNDGILRCTYLNFPKESMHIHFLKGKQLLYTKELGKTFSVTEGLNLSRLEHGNYEVILTAGSCDYSFRIEK